MKLLFLLSLILSTTAQAATENEFLERLINPGPNTSEKMLLTDEVIDPMGGTFHSKESDSEFFLNCLERNLEQCEKAHLMVKYNQKHYILARKETSQSDFVPMLIKAANEVKLKKAYKTRGTLERRNKVQGSIDHLKHPFAASIVTLFHIQDNFLFIFGLPFAFTFDVVKTPIIGGVILPINSLRLAIANARAKKQITYLFDSEAKNDSKRTKKLKPMILNLLRIDQFNPVF